MSAAVRLDVITGRERVGCKGSGAAAWLAARGVNVPSGANRYEISESGVLSARLATSEFLLESTDDTTDAVLRPLRAALERAEHPRGVYPVLRQDFVLEVSGAEAQQLFLQTCAVDMAPVARASTATAGPVIMTSMIGVSVVLTCRQLRDGPRFTLWSDPSYSTYFQSQLHSIAGGIES
jgi:sarcosine oxidase subunit gamma